MNPSFRRLGVYLLVGLLTAVPGLPTVAGQEADAKSLPPDLAVVTGHGAYLVSMELGKVFHGPEGESVKRLSQLHPLVLTSQQETVEKDFGFRPEEIERVIVFGGLDSMVLMTRKPVERKKLLERFAPGAAERTAGGATYYASEKKAVYPIDQRTVLLGTPDGVKAILERPAERKGASGELKNAVEEAAARPLLLLAANPLFLRASVKGVGAPAEPFLPLLEANAWQITLDTPDKLRLRLRAEFKDEAAAKKAAPVLDKLLGLLDNYLEMSEKEMPAFLRTQQKQHEGAGELAGRMESAIKSARAGLRAAKTRVRGNVAEAAVIIPTETPVADAVLLLSLLPRAKKQ